MALQVYERSDDTLMVALGAIADNAVPRSCGDLTWIGKSDVDVRALSPWVAQQVAGKGLCAVVADDALLVRRKLTGAVDLPRWT